MTEADTVNSKKSYSEIFDEQFPFCLSLGMTADEFWEGDITLPYFYKKAYKMQQKQKREHENYLAWLYGRYVVQAVASCLVRNVQYPSKPFEIEAAEPPKTKKEKQNVMHNAAEHFAMLAQVINTQMREKKIAENADPVLKTNITNTD